jgi:large subunit ribosomal protein L10
MKELMCSELVSRFRDMSDCLVVDYTRVSAPMADELRVLLRKHGAKMRVVRNRIAYRAFKEIGLSDLCTFVQGPSAIIYGSDLGLMCKVVAKWAREHARLGLRGGLCGRAPVTSDDVRRIAELPSIEVLRTRMVSLIARPLMGIAFAAKSVPTRVVVALDGVREKKERDSTSGQPSVVSHELKAEG